MSLVETLHAEHKARLARMGGFAKPARPVVDRYAPAKVRAGLTPHPHNYYWSHMWFWDLVKLNPVPARGYQPPMRKIIGAVSLHYGICQTDLCSERKTADIVRPRQVAMYLARHHTTLSYPQIGRAFGGRDHTTVLHSVRRIEELMAISPEMRKAIEELKEEVMTR